MMRKVIVFMFFALLSIVSFSQQLNLSKETVTEYQRLMKVLFKKHQVGVKKVFKIEEFSKLCLTENTTNQFQITFSDSSWIQYKTAVYDYDENHDAFRDEESVRSYAYVSDVNKRMSKHCNQVLKNIAIAKTDDDRIFWSKIVKIHRGIVKVPLCGNCGR